MCPRSYCDPAIQLLDSQTRNGASGRELLDLRSSQSDHNWPVALAPFELAHSVMVVKTFRQRPRCGVVPASAPNDVITTKTTDHIISGGPNKLVRASSSSDCAHNSRVQHHSRHQRDTQPQYPRQAIHESPIGRSLPLLDGPPPARPTCQLRPRNRRATSDVRIQARRLRMPIVTRRVRGPRGYISTNSTNTLGRAELDQGRAVPIWGVPPGSLVSDSSAISLQLSSPAASADATTPRQQPTGLRETRKAPRKQEAQADALGFSGAGGDLNSS